MLRLKLSLLGPPRITLDEAPIKIMDKALALLTYLAVEHHDAHRRGALVGLLWPDMPEEAARNNLRVTLHRLGQTLGRPAMLHSTRETIQWKPGGAAWLDVSAFQDLLHPWPPTSGADPWQLLEAVTLYRGDFLKNFYLEDSAAFEEWATTLRERLKQQALDALFRLADWHLACGDTAPAQAHARRQIELEPWSESAHRQLMLALARSGQLSAALAQYEALRRTLNDELGAAPSAETTALYQRLRVGATEIEAHRPVLAAAALADRAPLTPFIGREAELATIAAHLADPVCRLLTLVGPGGIGKTRLALQAAQAAEHIISYFVPLAGVEALEHVIPAIAGALGLDFLGASDPRAQLLQHLRGRELLLVLDNFEQLLGEPWGAGDLLLEILHAAPGVSLLITSRAPLDLQAEIMLDVAGLPVPDTETAPDTAHYSAVRLFVDRARRVQTRFALSAANQAWVVRICRLLEGMPLGIELAAAWVRVYTCDEIYRQLERNLDFLTTARHDVPTRHRSLRAVFGHSWNLLVEAEQDALRKVSVFRGGFRARAAARVADAPLAVLLTLLNKALLRQTPTGRYEIHELVRQYAEEKLQMNADEADRTYMRYANYFAAFLKEREAAVRHCDPQAMPAIVEEIQNLRAAWHWAAAHRQLASVADSLDALFVFFDTLNRFHEGIDLLRSVEAALQQLGEPASATERALLGRVLARQGAFYNRLSRYGEARDWLCRSLLQLRQHGTSSDVAFALHALGWTEYLTARYAAAQAALEECLSLRRAHDDRASIAEALYLLGYVFYSIGDYARLQEVCAEGLALSRQDRLELAAQHCRYGLGLLACARGEYEEAWRCQQEVRAYCRAAGFQWGEVWALHHLSLIAYRQGAYATAEQLTREGLEIAQGIQHRLGIAYGLNALGLIGAAQGRDIEATAYAQESLDLYTEIDDLDGIGVASCTLGMLACARGEATVAEAHFRVALRATLETGAAPKALEVLVWMAMLRARQDQAEQAVTLLALAGQHMASSHWNQARAARLLAELAAQLPPLLFAQAQRQGQAIQLIEVAAAIVGEHNEHSK